MSKGHTRRPCFVSAKDFDKRWADTYGHTTHTAGEAELHYEQEARDEAKERSGVKE